MPTDDELRQMLASQPQPECAKLLPFDVLELDGKAGFVRLAFHPQPAFGNHFGAIQGGFAAAMLDAPLSIAVFAKVQQWLPTVELKCSFYRPAQLGRCIGEGRVLRSGSRINFVDARLWGGDGELAVHATATVLGAG